LIAAVALGDNPDPSVNVEKPPAVEEFLILPLRIHVLKADLPEIDCALTDADVTRVVNKVNRIWHNAGIHWGLDTIVREPASRQERFRQARDVDRPGNLALYRLLVPESSRATEGLNVYYIHRFAVNGVWLGDMAFVQETARLREVETGIDEPLPRVTAHELGHALGLPHRQDRTNLLASGTTGTALNAREVETARKRARAHQGSRSVEELTTAALQAESLRDIPKARKYWSWLGELPGRTVDARVNLERLEDATDGMNERD
jgi:hypothetical protein